MTPHTCPRCGGERELIFRVASNPVKVVRRGCPVCKGEGVVWERTENGSKPRPQPGDKLEKLI